MSTMNSKNESDCNLDESNNEREVTESDDDSLSLDEHSHNKNPLLNSVVVNNIIQYLSYADLKNFRLVCDIWSSTTEPLLRKRSKIIFLNIEKGPADFLSTFRDSKTNIAFTEFIFSEKCIVSEVGQFFTEYGENIKSLKFQNVNMFTKSAGNQKISSSICNITQWIAECKLNSLYINCHTGTKLSISIDQLVTVKNLKLENCVLLLQKKVKISPSIISLVNVVYTFDILESPPKEFLLNDSFGFHKATEVNINHSSSSIILDVGREVAKINQMSLKRVRVRNWERSEWNVCNLEIDSVSFLKKISMKIKELKFVNLALDRIDLSLLPGNTLRKLCLQNGLGIEFIGSNFVYLPFLTALEVCISFVGNTITLNHFSSCPNLIRISLNGYSASAQQFFLDLNWLPKSIKKLEIDNPIKFSDTREESTEPLPIDFLTLKPYSFESIYHILQNIQPEVLIIDGCKETFQIIELFVQRNKLKKVIVSSYANRNVGVRRCEKNDANLSYYVFQDQIGKSLTRNEFEVLTAFHDVPPYKS